jgi:hypothetical protein
MKFANTKTKKILLACTITLVLVVSLCILFISPIAKYLLEKYDLNYLGREVKIGSAYVNPFTGYVRLNDVWISEAEKDTLFLSAKVLSGNFAMRKLFSNMVEINDLTFEEPLGIIIQKKDSVNFDDIIERFTPDDKPRRKNKSPWHVSIDRLNIKDGVFHYRERVIPIKYFIEKVNMNCSGIRWNSDTIASTMSFASRGGTTDGQFIINTKTLDYNFEAKVKNQDLEIIRQYLWELINYGMFRARMDANIQARGNFKDPQRISMKGRLEFSDFHLGKTTTYDYLAFKKLLLVMDELSPVNNKFLFDSITLDKSFFRYEHFDSLDNIEALFGKKGSNITDITKQRGRFNLVIEISRYIKKLARNFFESQYQVNAFAINDGEVKFSDFALNEEFSIAAQHVYIKADSISKKKKRVKFNMHCNVFPYGKSTAWLSLNPRDTGDLDLVYHLHQVPVTVFNPYVISYTSFPLDRGTLELNGTWKVRDGKIRSENNLVVVQPRVASRLKSKDIKKRLPLPLIMAFVRERGDVINYKIPITGNLKDPKFQLYDVLLDVVKNILIKPPTIPYAIEVKTTEKNIEEALDLTWKKHQVTLDRHQEKFLRKLAGFMEENKKATIEVYAQQYAQKEKEHILFYETKKKFYLQTHHKTEKEFSQNDSVKVEKMSVKEIGRDLVKDMRKMTRDTTMFTIHDKCYHYLGNNRVDRKYDELVKAREKVFRSYFMDNDMAARITFHPAKSAVPYNGFSNYHIKYKGEMPRSLERAYAQMNGLNKGIFRRKLLQLRKRK